MLSSGSELSVVEKLRKFGQEELILAFQRLSKEKQHALLGQIIFLSEEQLAKQQRYLLEPAPSFTCLEPFTNTTILCAGDGEEEGKRLVAQGKTALIVLAGGQGSRLKYSGPKGCVPISAVRKKTLYQLLAEKVRAASIQVGRELELAIMTSPLNHEETVRYFSEHHFFGLSAQQLTFFQQEMWPLFDLRGKLFLDEEGQLGMGPNGNGGVFCLLKKNGLIDKWEKQGVEIVNVIPVDNPLALPFDYPLFARHQRSQNEVTIKVCEKKAPNEHVGVLGLKEGRAAVIEYFELDDSLRHEQNETGHLLYGLANLGLFCLSLPFVRKISSLALPLHCAKKSVKMLNVNRELCDEPNAWKFEEFIFDVFPYAERVEALVCERSSCFAPLKNLAGTDSIGSVQRALEDLDRKIFTQVTGCTVQELRPFELAPQFYYPTPELLNKWKGKALPCGDYIDE